MMNVCVVGAGPSGLGAAHAFKEEGHTVTIFEAQDRVGGQWTCSYPDTSVQNTKYEYAFSDFPHSPTTSLHPSAEELCDYFQRYAVHKDLFDLIRFNTRVLSLERASPKESQPAKGWWVRIAQGAVEGQQEEKDLEPKDEVLYFDYVIVATGQFVNTPDLPKVVQHEIEDGGTFDGQVIHSQDYLDKKQLEGKNVAVVGFGKTALDIVVQAAGHGASAHLIYRQPRWLLPVYLLGCLHYSYIMFARHATFFLFSWFNSPIQSFFQTFLWGLIPFLFWRLLEVVIRLSLLFGPYHPLVPKEDRLEDQLRSAIALSPPHFSAYVRQKKIHLHQGEIASFTKDSVVLNPTGPDASSSSQKEGEEVGPLDMIICATGWKGHIPPFLPREVVKKHSREDGIHLYRHILHPDLPDLAFAGFNHGFMHLSAVELGMQWLLSALEGDEVSIPSKAEQLRSIEEEATFKDQHILFERSRSSTVGPRFFSYFSQLLQDLGMSSHIHKSNVVSDFLLPYGAEDYYGVLQTIATRRRRHRQKEKLMHSNGFRVGQQSKSKSEE